MAGRCPPWAARGIFLFCLSKLEIPSVLLVGTLRTCCGVGFSLYLWKRAEQHPQPNSHVAMSLLLWPPLLPAEPAPPWLCCQVPTKSSHRKLIGDISTQPPYQLPPEVSYRCGKALWREYSPVKSPKPKDQVTSPNFLSIVNMHYFLPSILISCG